MEQNPERKLILVNAPVGNHVMRHIYALILRRNAPFSLLALAALTPRNYTIEFLNQPPFFLNKKILKGALVGITCVTNSAKQAYKLALSFRKCGARVVLGGPHVTALPQEASQYADSVVVGEAESVWKTLVQDFENNSLKKIYQGEALEDFFSPLSDYLLNLDPRILRRTFIPISRGCKYHCDFCARLSGPPRYMKVEQVIELIKRIKQGKASLMIDFPDSNIFSDPEHAKELFKELIPLKIRWTAPSSMDIAFDEEALALAKQSGCRGLLIGFETIYPQDIKKSSIDSIASAEDYLKGIRKIKSHGIKVIGTFIVGFDRYTNMDYLKLLFFLMKTVIKSRLYWIALTILTPFPGSKLFEQLKSEGRITTFDWDKYDVLSHVVFKPRIAVLSLILWFYCIRIVTLLCSDLGLTVYAITIGSFLISHYIMAFMFVRFGI